MNHRTIAIAFLSAIFLPFVLTLGYHSYEKQRIKRAVKWKMIEGIDQEELTLLRFATENVENVLRWEHDGEFEYKGEMYDVVKREVRDDSSYFWCWWDHEETALNKKLKEWVCAILGAPQKQPDTRSQFFYFQKQLFFSPLSAFSMKDPGNGSRLFSFALPQLNRSISPPTPPPRM